MAGKLVVDMKGAVVSKEGEIPLSDEQLSKTILYIIQSSSQLHDTGLKGCTIATQGTSCTLSILNQTIVAQF